MAVTRLEALQDAIAHANRIQEPESDAYKLRNPLLIRSFALPGKNEVDEKGRRVFNSMISGYRAGLFDLQLKIEGKSRAKLRPEDPLSSLLCVYGLKEPSEHKRVLRFLRPALNDESLTTSTPISHFLEA